MIRTCHAPIASPLPIRPSVHSPSGQVLLLPFRNRIIRLLLADIVWLEGASNYTFIHTRDNKRYLASKNLKRLEPAIVGPAFCRVHKSAIINMAYLIGVHYGNEPHVRLPLNQFITISRRRLPATRRRIAAFQTA